MSDVVEEVRPLAAADWLVRLEADYLADYVPSGGSAVKFVSAPDAVLDHVREALRERSERHGLWFRSLDAGELDEQGRRPDLHRIDRFFFAVTAGFDWRALAAAQLRGLLAGLRVQVPLDAALHDLDRIAETNGWDPQHLAQELQRSITASQIRDHAIEYEFRSALAALAAAQLRPETVIPTTEETILSWLRGQTVPGGARALKQCQIYERINPGNARHTLVSFCHWLPKVGLPGLVAVLDFRPYEYKKPTAAQREREANLRFRQAVERGADDEELKRLVAEVHTDPPVTYGNQPYVQMLHALRRFVDDIDRFEHFLLVVLTRPGFYDETSPRSYYDYDALQTRIGQEVHDVRRANPSAALVRLGEPS